MWHYKGWPNDENSLGQILSIISSSKSKKSEWKVEVDVMESFLFYRMYLMSRQAVLSWIVTGSSLRDSHVGPGFLWQTTVATMQNQFACFSLRIDNGGISAHLKSVPVLECVLSLQSLQISVSPLSSFLFVSVGGIWKENNSTWVSLKLAGPSPSFLDVQWNWH